MTPTHLTGLRALATITLGALTLGGLSACKTEQPTKAPEAQASASAQANTEKPVIKDVPLDKVKAAANTMEALKKAQQQPLDGQSQAQLAKLVAKRQDSQLQKPQGVEQLRPPVGTPKNLPEITAVFEKNHLDIRRCYEPELLHRRDLKGVLVMDIQLTASGAPTGVMLTHSSLGNTKVETCLTERVKGWAFPPQKADTTVRHTVTLVQPWMKPSPRDLRRLSKQPLKLRPQDFRLQGKQLVKPQTAPTQPAPAQPAPKAP